MICIKCGMELDKEWKICPRCGKEISEQKKCAACGANLAEEWKACPYCGEELENEKVCLNAKVTQEKCEENTDLKKNELTTKLGRVLKILIIVAIACFFCPMYMVSCGGEQVATLSGTDLTFGFTVAEEEIKGRLIFGLLVLMPVIAFTVLLKIDKLDGSLKEGCKEIQQRFYICGALMASTLLSELYFFTDVQSMLEDAMILYEAMTACYILRVVAFLATGLAVYLSQLFESNEEGTESLSKGARLFRSIKNVVIITLIVTIIIVVIYSNFVFPDEY